MNYEDEKIIECSGFEEVLTDYLDGNLDRQAHRAIAAHALRCPLCHALLNEVKNALELCREISAPKISLTRLEAGILSKTVPETAMACEDFENYLTDYMDGFLPAPVFHRWERHAVLCQTCTDLPGAVVRSIAACYTYKMEELPMPAGLHRKILQATIGTSEVEAVKSSWMKQATEWFRTLSFPIPIPQLAPIAMILIFAVLIFSQSVSADSSISGIYEKSFEMAGQTYKQGADIMLGETKIELKSNQEPIQGTYVGDEENKR